MQLPFFSLSQNICQSAQEFVQSFIQDLQNALDNPNPFFSIDRFEGDFAVCENTHTGKMQNISLSHIPSGVKEGDILQCRNGQYVLSKEATESAQSTIQDLLKKNKQLS